MAGQFHVRAAVLVSAFGLLAACGDGGGLPQFLRGGADGASDTASGGGSSVRLVERDVEAPEVFAVDAEGLWDGRPSLGGVWVAHPDVTDPERVIIRNPETDRFVIGALFRRERLNPGPELQVSADAAGALGMLAGRPAMLNVTALRREEVAEDPVAPPAEAPAATADPLAETAAAAIAAAEARAPAPAPVPAASPVARPFIQIGIFSQEPNADRAAARMRDAGLNANILREESQGQTFWRVTVGPAATTAERDRALAQVRGLGFADAYAVSR